MMKYMYVWASAAVLLVHAGCSSLKERSASHQRQITTGQAGSALYQSYYDSTGRYWHFWSDSLFYYHPDSGLYGFSGELAIRDGRVNRRMTAQIQDSSRYVLDDDSHSDNKSKGSPLNKIGIVMIILIGLILGIRLVDS